jgi:hypothetical protein
MTGVIKGSVGKETYWIDRVEVTKEEFDAAFPDKPIGYGSGLIQWHKPVLSDALAVHPKQIKEAQERDRQHGINVEYLPDGRPKFTSEYQMRKAMKSLKVHRNNCFM